MPHAYLLEGNGGAKRRSCRPDKGVHERRNARIGITSQAHAAPLLYVRPHPTAALRAATLASSECEMHISARIPLRPLQRRFKARKKPEGYTSTPTGLKRLKTQNTAFRGNENGKGTPSGVPQPIHKRKLILVKEEFDASSFGGGAEDRTPVQNSPLAGVSKLSHRLSLGCVTLRDPRSASQLVQSYRAAYQRRPHEHLPKMTSPREQEKPPLRRPLIN